MNGFDVSDVQSLDWSEHVITRETKAWTINYVERPEKK